ncbi:MAG: PHP domain-containing protein [Planctomycetota bacterium]|jgi:predicted metal-dependent phosphoesterase TrpH
MQVDLHIHTQASDGCWDPDGVIEAVKGAGIGLFAIADHDTTENVPAVAERAAAAGLGFIPGVELCTRLAGRDYHVLGYGIDLDDALLQDLLRRNYAELESLDGESIHMLIEAGYDVSIEDFEAYENDRSRGGWRALNFMIDKGICTDVHDFFGRLFTDDLKLRIPEYASVEEAAHAIHHAGGVAVWAHPGHHWGEEPESMLETMRSLGVDGLECYSHYHDEAATERALAFCRRHDLLITAGSDCHGGFAGRSIGVPQVDHMQLQLEGLYP